jgi:hypothetical protein
LFSRCWLCRGGLGCIIPLQQSGQAELFERIRLSIMGLFAEPAAA